MTIDPGTPDAYAWPRPKYSPTLADLHAHYLAERQHTPDTASIPNGPLRWRKQTIRVLGEGLELGDAIIELSLDPSDPLALKAVRHEIADVVLSAVTLANALGLTIEGCIAEKTAADRGRG